MGCTVSKLRTVYYVVIRRADTRHDTVNMLLIFIFI